MTQEDKELLIKDLCTKLSHCINISMQIYKKEEELAYYKRMVDVTESKLEELKKENKDI